MEKEPHPCHFCGTYVLDGYETVTERTVNRDYSGDRGVPSSPNTQLGAQWNQYRVRHWLSDCRPDLVEHEIGPACTWWEVGDLPSGHPDSKPDCYAYQNDDAPGRPWTTEHKYFHKDGPM